MLVKNPIIANTYIFSLRVVCVILIQNTFPVPGVNDFIAMTTPNIPTSPPAWARGLSQDDINSMHR